MEITNLEANMYDFISGALAALSLVAAGFFLRFYTRIRDPFFLYFMAAFSMFGFERLLISLKVVAEEFSFLVYLIRLTGFLLILIAIIQKNLRSNESMGDRT